MDNYPLATETIHKEMPQRLILCLTTCHVKQLCWSDMTAYRDAWRQLILKVVKVFEEETRKRQEKLKERTLQQVHSYEDSFMKIVRTLWLATVKAYL